MTTRLRVAVVTGAKGDIGRAVVEKLTSDGLTVWGLDVGDAAEAMSTIGARFRHCDAQDSDSLATVMANIVSESGSLDVLVNSASARANVGLFSDSDPAAWAQDMSSFTMALASTRAALGYLAEGLHPRVVNIGSLSARGTARMAVYSAAKAALEGFTSALALELGPSGVTVNAVSPGPVEGVRQASRTPEQIAQRLAGIPLARFATPSEVAATVGFLVSPDADFLSGQSIAVSGGAQVAL